MSISDHLEEYLGAVGRGWTSDPKQSDVQICLFNDQPQQGVMTLATLGLSNHVLQLANGRVVRQELVLVANRQQFSEDLPKLLFYIAEQLLHGHQALLRGEVVSLGAPIAKGSKACHVYASMPVVFPDALATYNQSSPPTVIVWLFPVLPKEVEFISDNGWSRFEDLLQTEDPDLFNLNRESIL